MGLDAARFEHKTKRTHKREFHKEMNLVVPRAELVSLIAPHTPKPGAKGGRPPFAVETMLLLHYLQKWFNLSDPGMEEALYDSPMFREFAGLDAGEDNLPDESTILRFHHLFEAKEMNVQILATVNATLTAKGLLLKQGTVVDATLIVHIRHMANLPTQYLRRPGACDLWMHFAMNPVQQPAIDSPTQIPACTHAQTAQAQPRPRPDFGAIVQVPDSVVPPNAQREKALS